jgi:Mrp family chromosome partitioning ATPase
MRGCAAWGSTAVTSSPDDVLSAEDNEQIFRKHIVPMFLTGPPTQPKPVVVIVGGQTGAGKTAVTTMVKHALGQRGAFINMDFYNPMHPRYHRWRAEDEYTASDRVRPTGERTSATAEYCAAQPLSTPGALPTPRSRSAAPVRSSTPTMPIPTVSGRPPQPWP